MGRTRTSIKEVLKLAEVERDAAMRDIRRCCPKKDQQVSFEELMKYAYDAGYNDGHNDGYKAGAVDGLNDRRR